MRAIVLLLALAGAANQDPAGGPWPVGDELEQHIIQLRQRIGRQQQKNSQAMDQLAQLEGRDSEREAGLSQLGELARRASQGPVEEELTPGEKQRGLRTLRAYHPEAGIWAGHRTPDEKEEPVTAAEVAAEDFRQALTPVERSNLDAERAVQAVHREVDSVYKLPGPLIYTPPPDSAEVLEEKARVAKAKATTETFKNQQLANERQAKLDNAVLHGFRIPYYGPRKVNEAGRFCTKSRTEGCIKADLRCDPAIQKCVLIDAHNQIQIAEPPIMCPGGLGDCLKGAARAEGAYRLELQRQQANAAYSKAKDAGGEKQMLSKVKRASVAQQESTTLERHLLELKNRATAEIHAAQKIQPFVELQRVDPLHKLKNKLQAYTHRLLSIRTILQEVGLLAPECFSKHRICKKIRCRARGTTEEAVSQSAICRAGCNTKYEGCVVRKMKLAQAGASAARAELQKPQFASSRQLLSSTVVQELQEDEPMTEATKSPKLPDKSACRNSLSLTKCKNLKAKCLADKSVRQVCRVTCVACNEHFTVDAGVRGNSTKWLRHSIKKSYREVQNHIQNASDMTQQKASNITLADHNGDIDQQRLGDSQLQDKGCVDDLSWAKDCVVLNKMGQCPISKLLRHHCRKTCKSCNENIQLPSNHTEMSHSTQATHLTGLLRLLDETLSGGTVAAIKTECIDMPDWSKDCLVLKKLGHCPTSKVLRFHCRKSCNACTEVIKLPNNGTTSQNNTKSQTSQSVRSRQLLSAVVVQHLQKTSSRAWSQATSAIFRQDLLEDRQKKTKENNNSTKGSAEWVKWKIESNYQEASDYDKVNKTAPKPQKSRITNSLS